MDPVTHGLLGATASQSFASGDKIRAAAFTGLASAMIADLDVFISDAGDPLLNLEMHRQFSHSLVFIPVGALIASFLVWWFVRSRLSFKETYLFSVAAYATAGIADACTSYGVKLLWPFIDERYALNIISVFDPVFTVGLLLATALVFFKRKQVLSWLSWTWVGLYLIWGYGQYGRAANIASQIAAHQNHLPGKTVIKPTIANQLLWSIRYISQNDNLHAYGVRISPFADPVIYKGNSAPMLDWRKKYSDYRGTVLYNDIQRFSELSEGVLVLHPQHEQVIGDGRYAMLPTSVSPLWGIKIDTARPGEHVSFETYRNAGPEVRESFLNMLLGKKK